MDFTALRTQVIALLQREQRLAYRALQRQFALDDADLEALKDELIYAKRLAVDEDGRVLVGRGGRGPRRQPLQRQSSHRRRRRSPTRHPISRRKS